MYRCSAIYVNTETYEWQDVFFGNTKGEVIQKAYDNAPDGYWLEHYAVKEVEDPSSTDILLIVLNHADRKANAVIVSA